MRVEIDDDAFTSPDTPALLSLFRLGLERHRVMILDDPAPRFEQWRACLDEGSRLLCEMVLDIAVRVHALEPSGLAVRVTGAASSDWTRDPPLLGVEQALDLLVRPYRVLLENARFDGGFLLAMATEDERTFLLQRLDAEWLEFETCGGIDGVAARARELNDDRHRSVRASALFDSDASAPGQPSATSAKAAAACQAGHRIHHHQLARRAVENYVPISALLRWGGYRTERGRKVRAFARLTAEQQRHFHMKRGISKDDAGQAEAIFASVADRGVRLLRDGFGTRLSRLFGERKYVNGRSEWAPGVHENELLKNGAWAELRPFVMQLVERIR